MKEPQDLPPLPDLTHTARAALAGIEIATAPLLSKIEEQAREIERLKIDTELAEQLCVSALDAKVKAERERDELRASLEQLEKALRTIAEWDGEGSYPSAQEMFFIARKALSDAAREEKL